MTHDPDQHDASELRRWADRTDLVRDEALAEIEAIPHCRGCDRRVDPAWIICPSCRTRLNRVCPNCTRLVGLDWALCAWCGREFERRTKEWILTAGLVMIVVLMGLVFWFDILKKLEGFETRATLSSTDSPTRGIGAAPPPGAARKNTRRSGAVGASRN